MSPMRVDTAPIRRMLEQRAWRLGLSLEDVAAHCGVKLAELERPAMWASRAREILEAANRPVVGNEATTKMVHSVSLAVTRLSQPPEHIWPADFAAAVLRAVEGAVGECWLWDHPGRRQMETLAAKFGLSTGNMRAALVQAEQARARGDAA